MALRCRRQFQRLPLANQPRSGPKLLGTEFTLADPKHRLFDEVRVRAYNWGGEPYSASIWTRARRSSTISRRTIATSPSSTTCLLCRSQLARAVWRSINNPSIRAAALPILN